MAHNLSVAPGNELWRAGARLTPRRSAVAGLAGPLLFDFVVVLLTWLEYPFLRALGWSPFADTDIPWPSALALGPFGWLQVAGFVFFGLSLIALAIGLDREISASRVGRVGPMLMIVAGLALVLCGFKTDPSLSTAPATLHGWIHVLAFCLLILALLPAPFFIWRRARRDPRWRYVGRFSAVVGMLGALSFLAQFVAPVSGVATFCAFIAVQSLWLGVLSARLWAVSSQPIS